MKKALLRRIGYSSEWAIRDCVVPEYWPPSLFSTPLFLPLETLLGTGVARKMGVPLPSAPNEGIQYLIQQTDCQCILCFPHLNCTGSAPGKSSQEVRLLFSINLPLLVCKHHFRWGSHPWCASIIWNKLRVIGPHPFCPWLIIEWKVHSGRGKWRCPQEYKVLKCHPNGFFLWNTMGTLKVSSLLWNGDFGTKQLKGNK